jgi:uncharacterized membrane protein
MGSPLSIISQTELFAVNNASMASIFLAGREWLIPAACAFGVFLILVGWSYRTTQAGRGLKLGCAVLKITGAALLLACLLEPMWSGQRAKPGANLFAVVADNSRSMGVRDSGATETRGAALVRALADTDSRWRTKLAEDFEVRNYLADSRLLPTQDFHELAFDGEATLTSKTFHTLMDRHRGQPLAGLLFLTDGVVPDLDPATVAGLPPVYPVIFASDTPERDIALGTPTVTQTSFEDAPVTVQVEVTATGFPGQELVARLEPVRDTANAPPPNAPSTVEQGVTMPRESNKAMVRMHVRPLGAGVSFFRLRVTPKEPGIVEALTENNEMIIAVDRGSGQRRVLYVGGRPNWDYKFLNRAIMADEQTQLVSLVRIAKREPKFEFRGREGESSNPLFRGFGNQSKEEVERYDQPVLVRLNTENEVELRGGFPKRAEELFRYRAVILDDLEADFFTSDQMALLEKYVSERGGGLLMMGGAESFREGKFERTKVGEMLPIYLRGNSVPVGTDREWRLKLSREGLLEPWVRLRQGEAEETSRLANLPGFEVVNVVGEAKPGAVVVSKISDGSQELPAMVAQRFGRGRTAALLIGDFFQGGMGDEARQNDLARSWRQLVRWMVADVPDRIEVRAEEAADAVKIQVSAKNERFEPMDHARVTLAIAPTNPGTPPIILPAEPSVTEAGVFEATYIPRVSGGYRVEATVEGDDGKVAGVTQAGWTTNLAATEFRDLRPNRAAMELLAKRTGGRVVKSDELPEFARNLPTEKMPVTETWTRPLWHTPWVMLAALLCFVLEWGLRRRNGLA